MEKGKKEIMGILQKMKGKGFREDHDLITGGFLDSFELLMFIKELEECFSVHIPLEKINQEEFNSVESICEVIRKTNYKK